METGFVLINVRASYEKHVYHKLKHLPETMDVYPLFGEYDFIVKIKIENFDLMGEYIVNNIRTIDGIIKTKSLTKIQF
jgi:DNA-binding Lrp family transcriptional regulator